MKKHLFLTAVLLSLGILNGCAGKMGEEVQTTAQTTAETTTTTTTTAETSAEINAETTPETQPQTTDSGYHKIPNPLASEGSKFLFVGNSHTFTNDLPGMFYELAIAGGFNVEVADITQGAYALEYFADPEDEYGAVVLDALQNETWDFVILQDNTNSAFSGLETTMIPKAQKLDELIKKAGGQTAFLMTWSPKDGAGNYPMETVQSVLSANYITAAKTLDALLIPGGDIFTAAMKRSDSLELWGEDGQHPSVEGTYLAACTAYALFFQETPVGNTYLGGLDDTTATMLQQTAQDYMLK